MVELGEKKSQHLLPEVISDDQHHIFVFAEDGSYLEEEKDPPTSDHSDQVNCLATEGYSVTNHKNYV